MFPLALRFYLSSHVRLSKHGHRFLTMRTTNDSISLLRQIFLDAVDAVKPRNVLRWSLLDDDIRRRLSYADKQYHVVGFGKAVLGMAVQLERILGPRLAGGCISLPIGTLDRFADDGDMQLAAGTAIEVIECARNNLPDQGAVDAAVKIRNLAASLTPADVLCVLVSGGGSALLSLPIAPVTLAEKLLVINALASSGASIDELNTVRIVLSDVKGGKLAVAARNAFHVCSFILSDIVGDPVGLIASGPTVRCSVTAMQAREVLEKYGAWRDAPESVRSVIDTAGYETVATIPGDVFLVGCNETATDRVRDSAHQHGLRPVVLSRTVQGNVRELGEVYVRLAEVIKEHRTDCITTDEAERKLIALLPALTVAESQRSEIAQSIVQGNEQDLLLIGAGEPTVRVEGKGIGGRNQELALRFSHLAKAQGDLLKDVVFLSAGTDGIDGPTDAAGAVGGSFVAEDYALNNGSSKLMAQYIEDNDSYSFYTNLLRGQYHVKTGHTGTNVMDLHFLLIPRTQ